jgi:hypothetical protein
VTTQADKVSILTPKDASPEVDRLLLDLISEAQGACAYFEGHPYAVIFELFLSFFQAARFKCAAKEKIEGIFTELIAGLEQLPFHELLSAAKEKDLRLVELTNQISAAQASLKEQAGEASRFQGLIDEAVKRSGAELEQRIFATETALEQRVTENEELRASLRAAVEKEQELRDGILAQLQSVPGIAAPELERLSQVASVMSTIVGMRSDLSRAILVLADATSTLSSPPSSHVLGANVVDVQPEIDRLSAWLTECDELLEDLAGEREAAKADLEPVRDKVRLIKGNKQQQTRLENAIAELNRQISKRLASRDQVENRRRQLLAYQKAVVAVQNGVPTGLIGESLPELLDESESEEEPNTPPAPVQKSDNLRFQKLEALGQEYGLSGNIMLLVTLYEILHETSHRGLAGIFTAAKDSGLLGAFGVDTSFNNLFTKTWHVSNDQLYLRYRGRPAGASPTYVRTEISLPWQISDVVTDEEVQAFKAAWAARKVTKK